MRLLGFVLVMLLVGLFIRFAVWLSFRRSWDPVRDCAYYRRHGCAHVDGFLCHESCATVRENGKGEG